MVKKLQIASLVCLSFPVPCSSFPFLFTPLPFTSLFFSHIPSLASLEKGVGLRSGNLAGHISFITNWAHSLWKPRSSPLRCFPRPCFTARIQRRVKSWHSADGCRPYLRRTWMPIPQQKEPRAPYVGTAQVASRRKLCSFVGFVLKGEHK